MKKIMRFLAIMITIGLVLPAFAMKDDLESFTEIKDTEKNLPKKLRDLLLVVRENFDNYLKKIEKRDLKAIKNKNELIEEFRQLVVRGAFYHYTIVKNKKKSIKDIPLIKDISANDLWLAISHFYYAVSMAQGKMFQNGTWILTGEGIDEIIGALLNASATNTKEDTSFLKYYESYFKLEIGTPIISCFELKQPSAKSDHMYFGPINKADYKYPDKSVIFIKLEKKPANLSWLQSWFFPVSKNDPEFIFDETMPLEIQNKIKDLSPEILKKIEIHGISYLYNYILGRSIVGRPLNPAQEKLKDIKDLIEKRYGKEKDEKRFEREIEYRFGSEIFLFVPELTEYVSSEDITSIKEYLNLKASDDIIIDISSTEKPSLEKDTVSLTDSKLYFPIAKTIDDAGEVQKKAEVIIQYPDEKDFNDAVKEFSKKSLSEKSAPGEQSSIEEIKVEMINDSCPEPLTPLLPSASISSTSQSQAKAPDDVPNSKSNGDPAKKSSSWLSRCLFGGGIIIAAAMAYYYRNAIGKLPLSVKNWWWHSKAA